MLSANQNGEIFSCILLGINLKQLVKGPIEFPQQGSDVLSVRLSSERIH